MSKSALSITSFLGGVIALLVFIGITLGNWGSLNAEVGRTYVKILLGIVGVAVLLLLVFGLLFYERERWLSFTLAALLIIGFSISYFYSFGPFLVPLGITLLIVSIFKLVRYEGR